MKLLNIKEKISCKYLGISLEKDLKSKKVWIDTIGKLDGRIGSWKDKWLSKAKKIMKIRAVLLAIPIFPLAYLPLSNCISSTFESKFRNFLWNDRNDKNNLALIKWDELCKPKELGGLGIKKPQWQNEALGAKLIWQLYSKHNQKWTKIFYYKYLDRSDTLSIFGMNKLPKGFESWNFMVNCRGLTGKFFTWDVGLGDRALFWEDSWDGFPPITSTPFHDRLKKILLSAWGDKVIDYKVKYDSDGIQKWRWCQVEGLGLDLELVKAFEKIISERCIKHLERSNFLIWVDLRMVDKV